MQKPLFTLPEGVAMPPKKSAVAAKPAIQAVPPGEAPCEAPQHIPFTLPSGFSPFAKVQIKKPEKLRRRAVSLEGVEGSRVDALNYRGNGHWQWNGGFLGGKDYVGFIYIIEDTINKKLYLGKKQYKGTGKINKGLDTNWRWYISSSKELSEAVKANGKDGFKFYAIEEYKTKGGLAYAETWSLIQAQTPVYRDKWYNVLINKVSWTVREPPTERHKERMRLILTKVGAYFEIEDKYDQAWDYLP